MYFVINKVLTQIKILTVGNLHSRSFRRILVIVHLRFQLKFLFDLKRV